MDSIKNKSVTSQPGEAIMGYLLGIVFILDQPLLQILPEPGTGRKEISSCPVPGTSFLAQPANPETGTWSFGEILWVHRMLDLQRFILRTERRCGTCLTSKLENSCLFSSLSELVGYNW